MPKLTEKNIKRNVFKNVVLRDGFIGSEIIAMFLKSVEGRDFYRTASRYNDKLVYDQDCTFAEFVADITKLESIENPGATKEQQVLRFGIKDGTRRWDEYTKFQADKNKFEYKSKVHGWTKEQFDEYNSSRAVTLENLIERHGDELGKKMFSDYCKRQEYAGCKLEYFIETHGEEHGQKIYDELSEKKARTLDSYIAKYGDTQEARDKYMAVKKSAKKFHSAAANKFFDKLVPLIPNCEVHYQANSHGEYIIIDPNIDRHYCYDFTIPELKLIVEFNGAHVHASPRIYKSGDLVDFYRNFAPETTADMVWHRDKVKREAAEFMGYNIHYVWTDLDMDVQLKETAELINELHAGKI